MLGGGGGGAGLYACPCMHLGECMSFLGVSDKPSSHCSLNVFMHILMCNCPVCVCVFAFAYVCVCVYRGLYINMVFHTTSGSTVREKLNVSPYVFSAITLVLCQCCLCRNIALIH